MCSMTFYLKTLQRQFLHKTKTNYQRHHPLLSIGLVVLSDCIDIEVAATGLISRQNATYSSYRGMYSLKVIVGVAPSAVINYVGKLYPGSISDKANVQESGLLKHLTPGDMILADKGFLILDIVSHGISVNIPPFLNKEAFTERRQGLQRL